MLRISNTLFAPISTSVSVSYIGLWPQSTKEEGTMVPSWKVEHNTQSS